MYNEYVSLEKIKEYDEIIDNDPLIGKNISDNPIIREVCRAGQYLCDRLTEIECPDHIIGQIMYTAAAMCYGRGDPWRIHQDMYLRFIAGELEFQVEPDALN